MQTTDGGEHELIAVAVLTRPQGLQGFCRVVPLGGRFPDCVSGELFLGPRGEVAGPASVVQMKRTGGALAVLLEGIGNRTAAEGVRGWYLYARSGDLPPLEEDEFYHYELEGMRAMVEGEWAGCVESVHEYPTTDALEIRMPNGRRVIVPFTREAVPHVDRHKGEVHLDRELLDELL